MARAPSVPMLLPESFSALKFDGKTHSVFEFDTSFRAFASATAPFGPMPHPERSKTASAVLNMVAPVMHALGFRASASAQHPSSPIRGFFPSRMPLREALKIQRPSTVCRGFSIPSAIALHPIGPMSHPYPSSPLTDEAKTRLLVSPSPSTAPPSHPSCCWGHAAKATVSATRSPRLNAVLDFSFAL